MGAEKRLSDFSITILSATVFQIKVPKRKNWGEVEEKKVSAIEAGWGYRGKQGTMVAGNMFWQRNGCLNIV